MKLLIKGLVLALPLVLLTGCPSKATKEDDTETQVDTGGQGSVEELQPQTFAVEDAGDSRASELDDPSSPLAQRVIHFDYDKADIRQEFKDLITAHGEYLARNPNQVVTLEGHADERGSREYNIALGERRGNSVRKMLVLLGATAGQIKVVSYGEEKPMALGHDEESWAQNRRVEIVYAR